MTLHLSHNIQFAAGITPALSDDRVIAVLNELAEDHRVIVSACAAHGVDISAIDDRPVNVAHFAARELAVRLQHLDPASRPDAIGTPWAIAGPGYFTDGDHENRLHIEFDREQSPAAEPPRDPAGPRRHADVGHESLSFMAAVDGRGGAGARARAAVAEARQHLGTPYRSGGSTPQTHFDGSGLVQWAYAQAGMRLPRVSEQQLLANQGTPVERRELLPGDLVFFGDATGFVHHVGMSLGGDEFIHAPHEGDVVRISSLTELPYARQLAGGRRFDPVGTATAPDPTDVASAHARVARDAAEVRRQDSTLFMAVEAQEAAKARAIDREPWSPVPAQPDAGPAGYPGDDAPQAELATWLAKQADEAGLPPQLPGMARLVDPGQIKQFIDHALAIKHERIAAGDVNFGQDPARWGEWIGDVEARSIGPPPQAQ